MSSSQTISEPAKPSLQEPLLVKPDVQPDPGQENGPAPAAPVLSSSTATSSGEILNGNQTNSVESSRNEDIELSRQSSDSVPNSRVVINGKGKKVSVHWLDASASFRPTLNHSESFTSASQLITEEQSSEFGR